MLAYTHFTQNQDSCKFPFSFTSSYARLFNVYTGFGLQKFNKMNTANWNGRWFHLKKVLERGGPLAHPDFQASNETLDFLLENCKVSYCLYVALVLIQFKLNLPLLIVLFCFKSFRFLLLVRVAWAASF